MRSDYLLEEITLTAFLSLTSLLTQYTSFSAILSEAQNCKYKVNILRVKRKSTIWVLSIGILAPVFAQLIRTSD